MHRPPKPGDIVQIVRGTRALPIVGEIGAFTRAAAVQLPHHRHIRLLGSTAPRSARRKPATVAKVQEPASPVSEPAARSYGASGVDPSSLF